MLRTFGDSRGFRTIIIGLLAGVAALAVAIEPAEAKKKKSKKVKSYNPPYAAIVVDANSGGVMHAADADAIRHPASLTKVMTLYLMFEQLESGKFKLDTPLKVSEHASEQSPTKLDLDEGDTITVEQAIKALVTKSANDAAVVIAEAIAGDEEDFAKRMTRKARALGMSRTVYKNASGLPDREQVTTARDQALLGRAIQDRFPKFYRYFSTTSFTFRGNTIRNHNRLIGSVEGVDGIKTGYIHASGFNLITSMKRNNRHLVAVVLGGKSGSARDERMRSLIEKYAGQATARRTAPVIAERESDASIEVASAGEAPVVSQPTSAAATATATPAPATPIRTSTSSGGSDRKDPATTAAVPPAKALGNTDPIKPVAVKTIKVKLDGVQTASLTPALAHLPVVATNKGAGSGKAEAPAPQTASVKKAEPPAAPAAKMAAAIPAAADPTPPAAKPAVAASAPPAMPIQRVAAPSPAPAPTREAAQPPSAPASVAVEAARPPVASLVQVASADPAADAAVKVAPTGWIIQVGAFEAEREAKDRLSSAQSKAKHLLARADAFTETVVKDNKTFYRARFAGFDKDEAMATCKYLKRNDFPCMTLKN